MTGNGLVFKFLRRSEDEKHLMRFQSETSVSKFFRRGVHGAFIGAIAVESAELTRSPRSHVLGQDTLFSQCLSPPICTE